MVGKWFMLAGMLIAFIYILFTGKILVETSMQEEDPSVRIICMVLSISSVSFILYSLIYHIHLGLQVILNGGI